MDTRQTHPCAVYASGVTVNEGSGRHRQARLSEFSLALGEGEFVVVIGSSGSGKSALILALAGMEPLSAGEVLLGGVPARTLRQHLPLAVTYLNDRGTFYPELTVREILDHACRLRLPRKVAPSTRRDWLRRIIELTGIGNLLGERAGRLNAAQTSRVALAEGLVGDPAFLFLDELTRGLDPFSDYELMLCLQTLAREFKKTIVFSTQQMKSLSICDRIVFLHEGRSTFQGSFDQLWETHKTMSTRSLFGFYHDASTRRLFDKVKPKCVDLPPRPAPQPIRSSPPAGMTCQIGVLLYRQIVLAFRRWPVWGWTPLNWICLTWLALVAIPNKGGTSFQGHFGMLIVLPVLVGIQNAVVALAKEQTIFRKEARAGLSQSAWLLANCGCVTIVCIIQALAVTIFASAAGFAFGGEILQLFFNLWGVSLIVNLVSLPVSLALSSWPTP